MKGSSQMNGAPEIKYRMLSSDCEKNNMKQIMCDVSERVYFSFMIKKTNLNLNVQMKKKYY